ncbi:hypothetical protein Pmar_PMAR003667 [Perkinsus marinus ATCC 50983]|uniref:Apicomplexan-conserved protein n=1 Tax=Perkinsus marinus (strain ATCC 50983 / TXsc) TaxID=423536 RepID=C5KHZ2_PERM5|nr:hypothetical protein Pmar_PMAR003667 [Perkinsus marinus ATCC 50983]EER16204.1 hypothetical protein Pmar_PMAR003667 [Perkinsus marinus ATCC 50983]|eukprot:XP_002784408.1 hypothetical protein Pmar_PMAR003667 [Perkinsus marinus ATCC 50983]
MPSGGVTDVVSRDRPCSTAPVPAPNAMDMSRQQQRKRDLDQRSTKTVTEGDLPRGVDAKSRRCMTEDEEMRGRRNVSAVDSTFTGSTASCDSDEDFSIVSASAGTCKEDTLIIFDWDDTILPTRFLTVECGLRVDGPDPDNELRKILDTYAQLANATLLAAMELGTVMIVTNAETGWLPLTCAKFLPSMMPTVSMIYHTSARSTFEPRGFASAFEWKEQAFRHAIASHFADVPSLPG